MPSTESMLYIFLDLVTSEYYPVSDMVFERIEELSQEALRLFRKRSKLTDTSFGMQVLKLRERLWLLDKV